MNEIKHVLYWGENPGDRAGEVRALKDLGDWAHGQWFRIDKRRWRDFQSWLQEAADLDLRAGVRGAEE